MQLVLQRLRKVDDVRLGTTVGAVQEIRRKSYHRGNVDQQAVLASDKRRQRRKGQPSQRGDIQVDHRLQIVDLRIEKLARSAQAGMVDQCCNRGVIAEPLRCALNVFLLRQIGGNPLDPGAGGLQSRGSF